ncbi:MAG: M1 family metallopeptidase [Bacteroidia bacterium]|nr:M1 family metallopeptidase [Bacteroidia bacterium]
MKIKLLALCLFSAFLGSAQHTYNSYNKDATTYREHALDMIKMKVEVAFEPAVGLVKGKVTHQFKVLQKKVDSVFFDGPGIDILSATLNGKSLSYKTVPSGIWVFPAMPLQWDQNGEIIFTYTAKPRKGIYFIGWNVPEPKTADPFAVRKQIWTQGQGIDNRYWIPMYDDMNDKFITETVTTFDKNYQVLSNGKLLSKKENKDGTITWHYAMSKPHAGYLLMLGIGKYAVATAKSKSGVPLQYWYYPEFKDRLEPTYRYTPMMVDFLEEETGVKYPWESYSQIMVQDFLYGAMENTTATIFGDFFNVDARAYLDRNYVGVNCHELTHQWFGDYITARDGRDAWLQESFATYYPKQLSRVLDGEDEWNWQRRAHQNTAIQAGKKDFLGVRVSGGGTARVYQKGSAVISMLEYVLGSEQWKRVLKHYLAKHAYANVETNDLQQAIKDVLGLNLDWFFDQWIMRGGEPHYRVHYEDLSYQDGSRATEIAIEQIQDMNEIVRTFKMPIRLEVYYTDGSVSAVNEMISEAFEVVKIPNSGNRKIAFVLFDPNSNVLKQVTFKKSLESLLEQVKRAPYMLDRYDALVGLRTYSLDQKRDVLISLFKQEKHEGIVNEIISQLANDVDMTSKNLLLQSFKNNKAAIRDHAVKSIRIEAQNKSYFELALIDSSYDVVKSSLEKLCAAYPQEAATFLQATKDVHGMFHSVRMKWLELSIVHGYETDAAKNELVQYAGPAYEFRTRNQAFIVLKSTGVFTETLAEYLVQAMLSTNGRLAAPAADLAGHFAANLAYQSRFKKILGTKNFSSEEREILLRHAFMRD